jgi:hypothetical protein
VKGHLDRQVSKQVVEEGSTINALDLTARFIIGTKVMTEPLLEQRDFSEVDHARRRGNATGAIVDFLAAKKFCYKILYDDYPWSAWHEPDELMLIATR